MPVHELPADCPDSDGRFYSVLHALYGVGQPRGGEPWWSTRMREVAKVKASRRAHRASVADLYIATVYAKAHGMPVRSVTWLYRYISRAWHWWDTGAARPGASDLDLAYDRAIRLEMRVRNSMWLERLLRATDREPVYRDWLQWQADYRDWLDQQP